MMKALPPQTSTPRFGRIYAFVPQGDGLSKALWHKRSAEDPVGLGSELRDVMVRRDQKYHEITEENPGFVLQFPTGWIGLTGREALDIHQILSHAVKPHQKTLLDKGVFQKILDYIAPQPEIEAVGIMLSPSSQTSHTLQ